MRTTVARICACVGARPCALCARIQAVSSVSCCGVRRCWTLCALSAGCDPRTRPMSVDRGTRQSLAAWRKECPARTAATAESSADCVYLVL
ncbi:uncharacterized protein GGS25DRAFT_497618 [Hypoxylon fragiforme]|uniref:uncharacterized protein n=1 Tax=Hypoxylon fragiforme TaxID=63214 RepID=UPI0020C5E4C6|nr:uncharacterized protein GGS25DRAFT_497618 [Hypoxylon fragiforme]KAI2605698.1 hypothetical protein GGS25DRAFT_497618 [Hypoxylon fragiforme]